MKRVLVAGLLLGSGVLLSGCSLFGPLTVASSSTSDLSRPDPYGNESGVGGTGFVPGDADEGVGGTGIALNGNQTTAEGDEGVGGTGIFGVISAFGSIVVNGVHIDYEPATSVSVDGESGSSEDFAIGQTVAVEATPVGERYQARLVEIQHAVIGPVESVDALNRQCVVLGQTILVPETHKMPVPGEWVKVSGLRNEDDRVLASRIEITPEAERGLVRGILTSGQNGFSLSGLPVRGVLPHVVPGDEVLLRGHVGASGFEVKQVAVQPDEPFGGRMKDLLIDGAVRVRPDGSVYVAGHNWRLPPHVMVTGGSMRSQGLRGRYLLRGPWRPDGLNVVPDTRTSGERQHGLPPRGQVPLSTSPAGGGGETVEKSRRTRGIEWPPELSRERTRVPGTLSDPDRRTMEPARAPSIERRVDPAGGRVLRTPSRGSRAPGNVPSLPGTRTLPDVPAIPGGARSFPLMPHEGQR